MKQQAQFTRAELDLINDMAAIASAAVWGEGDYQGWTRKGKTFKSLRAKVSTLLRTPTKTATKQQTTKGLEDLLRLS